MLLLSKDIPSAQSKLVGYACFFASVFTFSLFLYEIRGMLRSGGLIRRGKRIEERLLVHGQFFQCEAETHPRSASFADKIRLHMNTTVASCFMYSLVFAFGYSWPFDLPWAYKFLAALSPATGVGLVIGIVASFLVRSESTGVRLPFIDQLPEFFPHKG